MIKKHAVFIALCCLFSAAVIVPGFSKGTKDKPTQKESFSAEETELGYKLKDNAETVEFIFDESAYNIQNVTEVYLQGSFNGWAKGTMPEWKLTQVTDTVWTYTCPTEKVRIPGNSGFPEFKFYVLAEQDGQETVIEPYAISTTPGYQMATNNLLLLPGDDPETVIENIKTSETIKLLAKFDLTDPVQRSILSNVRLVPGTTRLYRGYHPYKMSRSELDTESTRIQLVKEALEEYNIKSIITLSGEEEPSEGEEISAYHLAIREAGNQLYINTDYNTVYYHSDEPAFAKVIEDIITFINTHPGPYYIHCRLGTDRTGTTSAVMAALCGASWEDIRNDYQRTNLMGIKEFRDYRLLQYSFEQILDKPMSEVKNLSKELGDYFIAHTSLTQKDIDDLVANLK